ncbi:MAG: hypothetical protein JNK15_17220 [Planctomycetes bacterium]|nr:hypothetical protein [Planctomycetota bacterium]
MALSLFATTLLAQSPSPAAAGPARPAAAPLALATAPGRLHVDTGDPSCLWARGERWKASFTADGFTFIPFLGSDAPGNHPLQLRLDAITTAGAALPLVRSGSPTLGDAEVRLERGCATEVYLLSPAHVEQRFVFTTPIGHGALQVHLRVETGLECTPDGVGGFRFANERGGVHYGRALAFDARGAEIDVASHCADGELVLTVPADFVAAAHFPLTIDPVVSTFGALPAQVAPLLLPDVAFLGSWGGWYGTVVEEVWSATDHDVVVVARDTDGNLGDSDYVDFTSTSWTRPKIASHRTASQFLCVAQRTGPANFGIGARLVNFSALGGFPTLSSLAQIPVTTTIFEASPDVGGDASILATLPSDYCITWVAGGTVHYRRIDTTGTFGIVQTIPTPLPASAARIAKSCGSNLSSMQEWTIVFEQEVTANDHDVYGMRLSRTGVAGVPFPIATGPHDDRDAEVSSLADQLPAEAWLVVWERFVPGGPFSTAHYDIHGRAFTGPTPLSASANLTSLLLLPTSFDQTNPCVDTDGIRFAVGFAQRAQAVADVEPFLATLHLDGNDELAVTAYAELLNASPSPDDHLQIAAEHSGGASTTGYGAVWDVTLSSTASVAVQALYRGHTDVPTWFNHALPGCGAMQIVADGLPALGQVFSFALVNAQGLPVLALGTSIPPVPLCPACQLGVDPVTAVLLVTTNHSLLVPANTALIGQLLAAQGLDFLAPGGCTSPILATLTDEIIVTLL